MENEKISIIIPVFNSEKFLTKCVNSVLSQTYKNIEIIFVCDKSEDNSYNLCLEFSKKYDFIKTIYREKASGVSSARNLGIDNVSKDSKYISFLDADDWLDSHFCEYMIKSIETQKADITICKRKITKPNKTQAKKLSFSSKLLEKDYAIKQMCLGTNLTLACWDKIYRKDLLGQQRFAEDIYFSEDSLFVMEYIEKCKTISFVDAELYNYVLHKTNSIKQKFGAKRLTAMNALEKMKDIAKRIGEIPYCYVCGWFYLIAMENFLRFKLQKEKDRNIFILLAKKINENRQYYNIIRKEVNFAGKMAKFLDKFYKINKYN